MRSTGRFTALFCVPGLVALHALALAGQSLNAPQPSSAVQETVTLGERLYLTGTSGAGTPVAATVQSDLRVQSTDMPCVNCHRRSAWGTVEGPITVPPVTGDVLFAPLTRGAPEMGSVRTTGPGTRPAYTDAGLLRALRDGIDPAGRRLSDTMPRYDLSSADGRALAGYLRSLSAQPPPGVTDSTVHLATVLTPGVTAGARASMLDVLRTYVRHMNAGTRNETRRRQRGPWDMKQHYENYRTWVLHEWTLRGEPTGWAGQLRDLYTKQPVFALVGGISDGDWSPVHDFSARFKVPVILPQTPLPPVDTDETFYSLYFSRGVAVEAEALATHLAALGPGPVSIVQVSRCGAAGEAAARALAAKAAPTMSVTNAECVPPGAPLDPEAWKRLLGPAPATAAVLWLAADDLAALRTLVGGAGLLDAFRHVYVSSTLLGEDALKLPPELSRRGVLLHPLVAPDEFTQQLWRPMAWFKANQLSPADRQVAVNTLFAVAMVADALGIPRTLASREYFVERIEHMASRSAHRSAYPGIRFDSVRRFGSDSCSVLKLPAISGGPFRKVEEWIDPRP
jgi:hypothetical protein